MDRLASAGILLSRILVSQIFLFSGVNKIFAFEKTAGYMAAAGMKMTGLFLVLAIAFEIVGGLCVLLGYFARLGALALLLFLVPVTLVFHRNVADPAQAIQLAKNLAIMGGLLAILSVGGGEFSLRPPGRKK